MVRKLHVLFLMLMTLSFTGCSDKDEVQPEAVELTLDRTKVALTPNKSVNIQVETGNGEYTATTSNEEVAIASISGDVITITATTKEDRAQAAIVITDKMFKRKTIEVEIAKIFDLTLDVNKAILEIGVKEKDEIVVKINTGNFGYKVEVLDASSKLIEIDDKQVESSGKFKVKAIAEGVSKVKVTDSEGKEALLELTIVSPQSITVDKASLSLDAVQASGLVTVKTGNGSYKATLSNPLIAKASVNGDVITITGKRNGTTDLVIEDVKGQTTTVNVIVDGPEYAMNLSTQYFGYANFSDIAIVDPSATKSQQVTFEMTCKMSGYRGGQTFMGLEGRLTIRGKNDDYRDTHPIEIAGLGDKFILESTSSFHLNEWMNIALVVDCSKESIKDKYKLYINGKQDDLIVIRNEETHTVVDLASSNDGNRFQIGRTSGQEWRALNGVVSEARVWKVARTQQQIKDNMCSLTEQNPTGLFARWDFTAGVETGYIQDVNGGKYETNLIIANVKDSGYSQVLAPKSVFVSKGCPAP